MALAATMVLASASCGGGAPSVDAPGSAPTSSTAGVTPSAATPTYGESAADSAGRALQPTGLILVESPVQGSWEFSGQPPGPAVYRVVADGSGDVWVRGPWELTRVDPVSGRAQTWDAADDVVFAARGMEVAAASGAGVWLLVGPEALLFDGTGFARRLRVPQPVLAGAASDPHVHDLVDLGDEIWMSVHSAGPEGGSRGGVLRWSEGIWTAMSDPAEEVGGTLSAQGPGTLWAGGWQLPQRDDADPPWVPDPSADPEWDLAACDTGSGRARGPGVRRWDGQSWSLPGDQAGPLTPEGPGEVAVDEEGAVWFLDDGTNYCFASGYERWDPGLELQRFDGVRWELVDADRVVELFDEEVWSSEDGDTPPERELTGWLAAGPSGEAWVASQYAVMRFAADGSSASFGPEQGLRLPIRGLVVAAGQVVVLDGQGLTRLQDNRFMPVWREPRHWAGAVSELRAVSGGEVWARAAQVGAAGYSWYRLSGSEWSEVATSARYGCEVFASDGALWLGGADGLRRIADGRTRSVLPGEEGCPVGAGPDGSVWYRSGSLGDSEEGVPLELDLVRPDGRRTSLDPPDDLETHYCVGPSGSDGSLWIYKGVDEGEGLECHEPESEWLRWDGRRWQTISEIDLGRDGSWTVAEDQASWTVAEDGALWGWVGGTSAAKSLARYDEGSWAVFDDVSSDSYRGEQLIPALGDAVCRLVDARLDCYRADGSSTSVTHPALASGQWSVARDGTVWVLGVQIARLPDRLAAE